MNANVPGLVEHLFRHEAGKLLSGLARRLGGEHFDIAEESVQESLVRALKTWPYQGIPTNPAAWLGRTAHNLALDRLRRRAVFARAHADLAGLVRHCEEPALDDDALDDQLAMMFAGCHPDLSAEAQIALTLKAVCGFSVSEIGRAFLTQESTIAQRLVRAKRTIQEKAIPIAVPPVAELPARLDSVLHVIYLLFNEGYAAHQGDELVRHDLCEEAIRLGRWLTRKPATAQPKVHALLALMFLQSSRLPTRVDDAGNLLLLADQDRTQWDPRFIHAGLRHLDAASEGDEMTSYHLQAGIAAVHAAAEDDASTDWPHLLRLYDRLQGFDPSPIVALNRAIVLSRVAGPGEGLLALESLTASLHNYYLFHAVRGDFLARLERKDDAAAAYEAALALPCSNPERRFLQQRLNDCRAKTRSGHVEIPSRSWSQSK